MSHAYYVHKEDADDYDLMNVELHPLRDEFNKHKSNIIRDNTNEYERHRTALDDVYIPKFKKITSKYKNHRVISIFSKEYDNIEKAQYYVYYRKIRLDKEFGEKMTGVAEKGMESLMDVIKGDTNE